MNRRVTLYDGNGQPFDAEIDTALLDRPEFQRANRIVQRAAHSGLAKYNRQRTIFDRGLARAYAAAEADAAAALEAEARSHQAAEARHAE